jgi:hypothetical protein
MSHLSVGDDHSPARHPPLGSTCRDFGRAGQREQVPPYPAFRVPIQPPREDSPYPPVNNPRSEGQQ